MEPQRRRLSILSSHLRPILLIQPASELASSPSSSSSSSSSPTSGEATPTKCSSMISPSYCDSCPPNRDNHTSESDCVFCKIIRGEAHALKLYEDDECLCFLDSNPVSPGHCLIVPRGHFPSMVATPPSVVAAMCSKVPCISKAVMKATGSDSFNLLVNNGVAAGQVIFHTHIHIIPRKARDCLWASESLKRLPLKLDQGVLHLVDNIREQLNGFDDCKDHGTSLGS